ncbi:MAG TPA: HlyD family secretion protein [Chitinophagales bacterium]|nr:HlyD family secretion protein [Chitinophagales bacterium]
MSKETTKTIITRVVLALLIIVGGFFGFKKINYAMHHETTDNAQVEARFVPILPRVAGYIKTLHVEDYSTVKKDSLLAEIDDSELALQLEEMEADLAQAETDIENARANITNTGASVVSAKSNLDVVQARKEKAQHDFERDQNLFKDGAITQKQFDDSKANLDIANRQYEVTKNDVAVAQSRTAVTSSTLKKAEAQIAVKKARIEQQKLKLSYTKIYSTSDGKIGRRNIDAGQFVQAGTPLFTIINDNDFWVVANFKETQLEHVKLGQEVEVKLDAFKDQPLKGKIVSVSDATGAKFSLLPPDNATGNFVKVTQRIPVKIEIEDLDKYKSMLRAGMSVEVAIAY